jgi:hypothetical protein
MLYLLVFILIDAARGIESTHDALFVKELCHALDIPCYLGRRSEEGQQYVTERRTYIKNITIALKFRDLSMSVVGKIF